MPTIPLHDYLHPSEAPGPNAQPQGPIVIKIEGKEYHVFSLVFQIGMFLTVILLLKIRLVKMWNGEIL
jgi:hypothetical protein